MSPDTAQAFDEYRKRALFLLVGANPLPNYVASLLLAEDGGTVHLLHTKATASVAELLARQIHQARSSLTVCLHEIAQAGGKAIRAQLQRVLDKVKPPGNSIGFNYTGGTKPMAVHVRGLLHEKYPAACLSYLDAHTLKMYIDGDDKTLVLDAARAEELELTEVLALHGYELTSPGREPRCPKLRAALVRVCAEPQAFQQWTTWLGSQRPLTTLPTLEEYPRLGPVIRAFDEMGGDPVSVASQIGYGQLNSCRPWLRGLWQEDHTFEALRQISGELGIRSIGIDLRAQPTSWATHLKSDYFQLDVAAMVGYQLFAISCIASDKKGGRTKQHLFEAFVRARQLGGDEARIGLVCCLQDCGPLQSEIERKWDAAGQIKVFGGRDLSRLALSLKQWIRTANKEEV
jgi:hypothetical protein